MKIAIIGAGAMGSLFGGHLSKVAEVCLYDVNAQHVGAIQQNGLRMTRGEEETVVHPRATTNPAEIGTVDAAIFFTKYTFMEQAVGDALPCIGPDTFVLTLQNGIGSVDVIKKALPEEQVAYGLTAYTSDMKGPGHIELTTQQQVGTYFWPCSGKVSEKAKELEKVMNEAGFHTEITEGVNKLIWRKLMINCSENPLCALLRVNVGQLVSCESSYEILKAIVYEIADVARAKGIDLSREEGLRYVNEVSEAVPGHLPSMALDVANGRKTEIACLNEAVAAEGARLGIATPTLSMVGRMIRTLEGHYQAQAF